MIASEPAAQRLWLPFRLPGGNEIIAAAKGAGGGGYRYAAIKLKLTGDIALLARRLRPVGRARFRFIWHERNRQRNPDNIAAGKKFILDGLQMARVLENDGWSQVAGWTDEFVVASRPGVLIEIEDAI